MDYTDPSDMPDDERMTAAEFRVVREFLNVTGDWLAGHLKVNPRTVRSWEQGRYPIPDGVRIEIEKLEAMTAGAVGRLVAILNDEQEPAVIVYRDDAEYAAHQPAADMCASWYRAVVARAALEVPGLVIDYPASTAEEEQ